MGTAASERLAVAPALAGRDVEVGVEFRAVGEEGEQKNQERCIAIISENTPKSLSPSPEYHAPKPLPPACDLALSKSPK